MYTIRNREQTSRYPLYIKPETGKEMIALLFRGYRPWGPCQYFYVNKNQRRW